MNFSQAAAIHLLPLIYRLVICVVVIPAGWGKMMTETEYSGSQLDTLVQLGVVGEADTAENVKERSLYGLAVLLQDHELPKPVITAWVITLVELIGGGLLLIGLLSRLWALGIAAIMAGGFALESIPAIQASGGIFDLSTNVFNMAAAQLALAALALGVLVSGSGFLSLDRAIFGKGTRKKKSRSDEDEEELDFEE
jgi:putative oxidoreductase